ncbi:MAG TPA: ammonium transporter [Vicinamibacterales bacterium]|nr:ammonium transporter [Vicinamibacterales bacterium]
MSDLLPIAQAAFEPDTGDTAWMLTATALVILMTIGLGVFYAGLVRAKNALNTFMMCIAALAVVGICWALVGYSLAFGGTGDFIGNFDYAFLNDVGFGPYAEGQTIPHLVFFAFQGSFCIITAALVSGAVVERMRFSAYLVFLVIWSIAVYPVMAHWVFGGGFLFDGGTLDFAGGISVEMGSGFSALAAALVVGARKDYGRQALLPHNGVLVLLGAGLLWFGWFGFNGGSGIGTGNQSVLAFANTLLTPAAAIATWFMLDAIRGRKVTAIGAATAIIVGCVLITPAGGFVSPGWALVIGVVGTFPCYALVAWRPRTRVDETLDVLAVHGLAGFLGILAIGFVAQEAWNGVEAAGLAPNGDGLFYGGGALLGDQALAALIAPAYAFAATFVILKAIGFVTNLRASQHEEAIGLDVVYHGEEAYPTGEGAILVSTEAGVEEPRPVADAG